MNLMTLGWLAEMVGDYPRARALLQESQALVRDAGDRWELVRILRHLGRVALD
jgi:hypothetical protein